MIRLREKLAKMDETELGDHYAKERERHKKRYANRSEKKKKEEADRSAERYANMDPAEKKKRLERDIEWRREQLIANPTSPKQIEKRRANSKASYAKNREAHRARCAKWKIENADKVSGYRITEYAIRRSRRAAEREAGTGSAKPERKVEVMLLKENIPFVNNKFECIPRGLGTKRKKFSPDFTTTVMRIPVQPQLALPGQRGGGLR